MRKTKIIIVNIARVILALTFIFSGFVKAIDSLGSQYKIKEYIEVLHMSSYVPDWVQLLLSIGLSAVEFTLGVLLLLAIQRRKVSRIVLVFAFIMTIITLWLTISNPIQDCGCFGDALKLTNIQTFSKNIILFLASLALVKWPLYQPRFISKSNQWIASNFTIIFILVVSALSLYHLPIFDFRPYFIGQNIKKAMEIPKGAKQTKFKTTFICEKNGITKEFDEKNYPYNDTTWVFKDSRQQIIEKGYEPPIHDFSITNDRTGEDITGSVLTHDGYVFLLIIPFIEQADDANFSDIDAIYKYAKENNYPFMAITASTDTSIKHWRNITGAEYPFYSADGTTLKTIIRSNPGLVLLYKGTIINKWNHNDIPKAEKLNAPLNLLTIGHEPEDNTLGKIVLILLCYVLPLILLIVADRFWAWSVWIKKKERWIKVKEKWLINQEKGQTAKMLHKAEKVMGQAEKVMGNAGKAVSNASKSMVDKLKNDKKDTPDQDKTSI